nr:PREDICTED: uncharacterized protein LOC104632486 [Balearica regulorum gibbericeps]
MSVIGAGSASTPVGSPSPARPPLTHTGLRMAPCDCCFDPWVFCIQWTSTNLSPLATSTLGHSAASLPGAVGHPPPAPGLGGPWDPPGPTATLCTLQLSGESSGPSPRPSAAAMLSKLLGTQQVTFHCPRRCYWITPWSARTVPAVAPCLRTLVAPESPISYCYTGLLSLPRELLTPDYSIPETSNAVLSLQQFNTIRMGSQELWWGAGTDLPPSQPGRLEKQGESGRASFQTHAASTGL